jgi:site-specific DNA-methyltransferase (adenine-specific)
MRIRPRAETAIDRSLWGTPWALFDVSNARFGFTLDVCAQPETAKLPKFFTPETDGLLQSWADERVWMNPPYGPAKKLWLKKAVEETRKLCPLVVGLIPPGTDAQTWHQWVLKYAARIICLEGRVNFELPGVVIENGNTDPSLLVVWVRGLAGPPTIEGWDWRHTRKLF